MEYISNGSTAINIFFIDVKNWLMMIIENKYIAGIGHRISL